jgi:hypothetical protein
MHCISLFTDDCPDEDCFAVVKFGCMAMLSVPLKIKAVRSRIRASLNGLRVMMHHLQRAAELMHMHLFVCETMLRRSMLPGPLAHSNEPRVSEGADCVPKILLPRVFCRSWKQQHLHPRGL